MSIRLGWLSSAEKDALILSLLPLVGQLQAALARISDLEKRLAAFERPPKTPDTSSLPPSRGQKPDCPAGDKAPRKSRPGFGRALEPNPDRIVDAILDACPHCAAAFPAGHQTPQQVYDRKRKLTSTFRRGFGLSRLRAVVGEAVHDGCERVLLRAVIRRS